MSKPGRKPSGTPYRLKSGGNWRVQIKGMGIIDLGTDDEQLAQVKVHEILSKPKEVTPNPKASSSTVVNQTVVAQSVSTPAELRPDVIDNWLKTQTPEPPKQTELPLPPKETVGYAEWKAGTSIVEPYEPIKTEQPSSTFVPTVINGGKKQKGPTPEQLEKLSKGLYKIATKVNIVAAEACVKFLGKDPCPLDDDEVELLQMGWEMQLNEWFGKSKPEPWMVLLAGNAAILFAMYVRGDDLPKKDEVPSNVTPIT